MLNYFLDNSDKIVNKAFNLSENDKRVVFDAVRYAINQTRVHITNTRKGRKDDPSASLSNVWLRTSKKLLDLNKPELNSFAQTIMEKSKYWASPNLFNPEDIDKLKIKLDQVESKLNNLCG